MGNNIFSTMLEVKFDKELNKYLVTPIGTEKHEDYAIVCKNEYDAKSLCAQIAMQMMASPTQEPLKYSSLGVHLNGRTHLYCLK